jgi:glycosyltransferase involved in cell wall biosynthesis
MTTSLVVVILTHNEALHIERCLDAVNSFASACYIIDSGSTDGTVELAGAKGATVLHRKWKNYADQFQWALDTIETDADWIMRLDADEVIEPDLAERIRSELPRLPADVVGINIDRKHIFMDRFIRHGGRFPLTLLRIFRRGHGRIEQRWMDEHILVEGGRTVHFAGGFADQNLNDLTFFTDKHNKYATREAIDVLNQRLGLFARDVELESDTVSRQAALKRWIKEKLYNRIPFTLSSLGYFLFRYIFQLGFLDGRAGLVYHFLQGYWYRFLVGAKLMELEQGIAGIEDKAAIRQRLEVLTGHRLG